MASTKTQPARGMRDFLPEDVRKREYVIGVIKDVYQRYGFEPQRLSAAGFAEYHPVSSNENAEGRARNRRVDIVILNPYPANPQANSGGSSETQKAP